MRFCARLAPVSNQLRPYTKGILDFSVRMCWEKASGAAGTRFVISLEEQVTAA